MYYPVTTYREQNSMKSIYNPRFWTQPLVATWQGLYGHATYPNVIGGVGS